MNDDLVLIPSIEVDGKVQDVYAPELALWQVEGELLRSLFATMTVELSDGTVRRIEVSHGDLDAVMSNRGMMTDGIGGLYELPGL